MPQTHKQAAANITNSSCGIQSTNQHTKHRKQNIIDLSFVKQCVLFSSKKKKHSFPLNVTTFESVWLVLFFCSGVVADVGTLIETTHFMFVLIDQCVQCVWIAEQSKTPKKNNQTN